jgi:hypothetical protein
MVWCVLRQHALGFVSGALGLRFMLPACGLCGALSWQYALGFVPAAVVRIVALCILGEF